MRSPPCLAENVSGSRSSVLCPSSFSQPSDCAQPLSGILRGLAMDGRWASFCCLYTDREPAGCYEGYHLF